jgi:DNA-binding ferritin-like protein
MRTPTPYHHSTPTPISVVSKSTKLKSLNSSGDIILFFMDMLTTVKLYHWKTMNYATHKATDELYDDLNKYVDEFVEVLLGYKGGVRAKLPRTQVTLHDCNSIEEFKKKIDGYKNVLIGFTSRFDGKKNSDLLNIRDEILATLNKSLYVMSFK